MPDPLIDKFDFSEPYEIVGYGRARHNFERPTEVQIEVFLAAFSDERALPPSSQVLSRWIGCGQLDLIPIGSVWQAGARVFQREGLTKITAQVEFAGRGTLEAFGASDASLAPMSMNCFRLKLDLAGHGPRAVWVPIAEVMRVFFGVSSRFLIQMCGGIRTPDLAEDSAFFDRHLSQRVNSETFNIACTRNPSDREAIIIAGILAHSAYLKAHDSVFKEMETACRKTPLGGPLSMLFPFDSTETIWSFEGRWIPLRPGASVWRPTTSEDKQNLIVTQNPSAFLVTRIFHMQFPLPFTRIQIAISSLKIRKELPPPDSRTILQAAARVRLQSTRPAGSSGASVQIPSQGAVLEPARPVEIIRLPREEDRGKSRFVVFDPVSERLGATADRQPGGGRDVAHVVISRVSAPAVTLENAEDPTPATRAATFDCVASIASERGWKIVYGQLDDDDLPLTERIDKSMDMLVMAIRRPSGIFYVADAGTAVHDARSLGLLTPYISMDLKEAVGRIVQAAADNGARWLGRRPVPGFRVKGLARQPTGIWKDFSRYRERLARALDDIP